MKRADRIPWAFRALLLLLPKHLRAEHEDELRQFLELEIPEGGVARVRYWVEALSDMLRASPGAHLDILRQDTSLAIRQLRRAPGYAALATMTLALGIGGNVALFKVAYETLFADPPFIGADRLVRVDEENLERGLRRFGMSPANFVDYREAADDMTDGAAVWQTQSGTARLGDRPTRVRFVRVSGEFFRVFRESPVLGRTIRPEEDTPGSGVVVASHSFWTTELGSDPDVVGRIVEINEVPHRVIGVMPEGFEYPGTGMALWTPIALPPSEWERRGARFVGATFRLRPGVAPEALAARVSARAAALADAFPETNEGWTTNVLTLRQAAADGLRGPLLLVWLGAGLILLIAVANVANLLLGRAVARSEEMQLRRALGARSSRIFRQTLTEGAVLSLIGTTGGLAVAAALLKAFEGFGAGIAPVHADLGLDPLALGFTLALALIVTTLFGFVPVVGGRRLGAATAHAGRRLRTLDRARLQSGLVIGEIALAVVVAVSTGLLARSAIQVLNQPLGYVPQNVTTFRVEPPMRIEPGLSVPEFLDALEADRKRIRASYAALLERLRAEPTVAAAGAVNRLPLTGNWWITGVAFPGASSPDEDDAAFIRVVMPGFLETMGTGLLEGRHLDDRDAAGAETAIVIDRAFADRHWPGRSPIGEVVHLDRLPDQGPDPARVVGVVESIRQSSLEAEPRPTFYISLVQALEGHGSNWGMDVVVKTKGRPIGQPRLEEIARDFLPAAAVFRVLSMEDLVSQSIASRRFQVLLFGGFAVTAFVLTLVGVFGVLALFVRERTREFGVRQALGASPWSIRWLVQRNALRCAAWGSATGLLIAFFVAGAFESLVYGISAHDPIAFAIGPIALCAAALAGGLAPAWLATRADPAAVLRSD